jgi:hypothetical protein
MPLTTVSAARPPPRHPRHVLPQGARDAKLSPFFAGVDTERRAIMSRCGGRGQCQGRHRVVSAAPRTVASLGRVVGRPCPDEAMGTHLKRR